ncbi:hypothetical protein ACWDE9_47390 [Streptomyces olivaceoviridis]
MASNAAMRLSGSSPAPTGTGFPGRAPLGVLQGPAEAEARHLKERLDERAQHIEDLQRAIAALTPAPQRAAIPQPAPPATAPAHPMPAPAATPAAPDTAGTGDNHRQEQSERRRWWSRRG